METLGCLSASGFGGISVYLCIVTPIDYGYNYTMELNDEETGTRPQWKESKATSRTSNSERPLAQLGELLRKEVTECGINKTTSTRYAMLYGART